MNDIDEEFVIDTGSPHTWITREIQEELALSAIDQCTLPLANKQTTVDVCRADLIVFGRAYHNHKVLVGDALLLGRDVLKNFVLIFDGPRGAWSLDTRDQGPTSSATSPRPPASS